MKHSNRIRLLRYAISLVSLCILVSAVSCRSGGEEPGDSTPDSIPVVSDTESSDPGVVPVPVDRISVTVYASAALPDYGQYTSAARIREVLSAGKTYAFSVGAAKYYKDGVLCDGAAGALTESADGTLQCHAEAMEACTQATGLPSGTPTDMAAALGMQVAVYDGKLVLFYEGDLPLHTYEDIYTYEAMYLYMTEAGEVELTNAFVDLPDRISNRTSNTVYYTAPDLNLGLQTSVYYAQMGQTNGLSVSPSLVAGEGRHENNYTTVRIFNNQQTCVTQFLAFDASVRGGVQVAAAAVGEETLIATAPFAAYEGDGGDVRVFDAFGLLRMSISVRDAIGGPYTILTGRFAPEVADEVLLVASQATDENGMLAYALISLADGSVIAAHTLDASFALGESKAAEAVHLSVRRGAEEDTVILHFPSKQLVYEGSASAASFDAAGITLPPDALSVSASTAAGERYIVSLPAREDSPNQSFVVIYRDGDAAGETVDVGFRENRFYSARYIDYNDDLYVSKANFQHIRTDFPNIVFGKLASCDTEEAVDALFDSATYADYAFGGLSRYTDALQNEYVFLEPCFSHRWNQVANTANLASYVDPVTGMQKYVATGKSGEYIDYEEIGSSYYNGTYADGILDLAKWRLYPLRSFLQGSATAFRGEGADPEHLVGMSPVHEHEINVPDSVGDYNLYMLEGFRNHMLNRYGSVENINARFGTAFASVADIDAPRDAGRGAWDAYSGDYFTEWAMYNRYIVSKRIMEAYREALLAGYPPESITAHQIPEGEAVSGFLGEANTRLTPVDVVLTCGTAYGGTRYGFIIRGHNFVSNSNAMGHWNTSINEYCSLQANPNAAYRQLEYLWERGVRMIHQITFSDDQTAAEEYAVQALLEKNQPRPGYTGGTYGSVTVSADGSAYNILQIGAGADSNSVGLLKSVDAEGKWEGTVYLVPFHAEMRAASVDAFRTPVSGTTNRFSTGTLPTIKNADQVEITFAASYAGGEGAYVTIEVYHDGFLMDASVVTYELTSTLTPYRYVLSNQLYESGLEIVLTVHTPSGDMSGVSLEEMDATLQTETTAFTYYNGKKADEISRAHVGGVTFDLLDRDR